jgi:hypothetical protein
MGRPLPAERFRSLTSNDLPLTAVGSNPDMTFDYFMQRSYPASLRNVGSTQVPVRVWNNARKGTLGLPPPLKLESRHMTYTVSVRRNIQSNKQTASDIDLTKYVNFNNAIVLNYF